MLDYKFQTSKRGNGAFSLCIETDGTTHANGMRFANPQDAFDHFKSHAQHDHSSWNVCYNLTEFL